MKDTILNKLKEQKGQYVSGEILSGLLGVSRTVVWKYMKELKKEGYLVESSSKKGYKLMGTQEVLNSAEISQGLETRVLGRELHCLDEIDSTNNYAKKIAIEGCADGALVVAKVQTAGRGRLGRRWDSSEDNGIWMSIVLRPLISPESVQVITLAASVAVTAAIYAVTGVKAGIKWPNDIIINGKKVCGILTEMSCEMDRINFLVIGIGINVNQDLVDFTDEIKSTAISLKAFCNGASFSRSELIKNVLFELEKQYDRINTSKIDEIINEWKMQSVTLGRDIKVNLNGSEITGIAEDITKDGKLIIKSSNGELYEILSGEISVRGILGYV